MPYVEQYVYHKYMMLWNIRIEGCHSGDCTYIYGMWRHIVWQMFTDVSEERTASIFMAEE
jgi:hypothetical protein